MKLPTLATNSGRPPVQPGDDPLQSVPVLQTTSFRDLRVVGRLGLSAIALAALALGVVVGNTVIAGAIIATGVLVVDSGAKQVQHPSGGVVAEVLVRNGDRVMAGQPLVRLDQAVASAKLASAAAQLLQTRAQMARLAAERDDLPELTFEQVVADQMVSPDVFEAIKQAELNQFSRRREELTGQVAEIDERIEQTVAEAHANEAQLKATLEERKLLEKQLVDLKTLYNQQLLAYSRLSEAELALTRAIGTEGRLRSAIAASKAKLAELKVTKIQLSRTWRTEVASQIAHAQSADTQLTEQVATAQDQLQRSIVRAPQEGFVHDLATMTEGTVVQPAQTLMMIVPDHDKLVGEVKIRPTDIDQLFPGQDVTLQFSAFERATTPNVDGKLTAISADLLQDPHSGSFYYKARIEPEETEALMVRGLKPVPGMPIEAFIKTEDRTIFSYLTKPIFDQANRAFR